MPPTPLDRLRAGPRPTDRRPPRSRAVLVTFHGGSYAAPGPQDGEVFPSLAAAAREYERRLHDSYYPLFHEIEGVAEPADGVPGYPSHVGHFTRSGRFVWERA